MTVMELRTFSNPFPEVSLSLYGAALLQALETQYPALAKEFLGLFSYRENSEQAVMVAVGCQFRIDTRMVDGQLEVRLLAAGSVISREFYPIDSRHNFHQQAFNCASIFMKKIRPLLVEQLGLSPETPLLGGWRCGAYPELVDEYFVFTLPRILLRLDEQKCQVSYLTSDTDSGRLEKLISYPNPFHIEQTPKVVQRRNVPECQEYIDLLVDLIDELSHEQRDKVVISREVVLQLKGSVSPAMLLPLIAAKRQNQYEYVFRWDDGDAWLGISPETLIRKKEEQITVEPLAGTRKGSDTREKSGRYREELMNDSKEIEEHETAAELFFEQLSVVCEKQTLRMAESRNVIDLGYVQHLKSKITGKAKPNIDVFNALSAVYPPATIWGKPIDLSGDRIRRYEKIDRGFFTGGFGYTTLDDQADFALAIRTARLSGNELHVYAGSGIVKGSDPYKEWLETSNKMGPFLVAENW